MDGDAKTFIVVGLAVAFGIIVAGVLQAFLPLPRATVSA